VDFGVGLGQLVGEQEARHHQKAGIAHLADRSDELRHLAVDVAGQLLDVRLLAVVAGDLIGASVDLDVDMRHGGYCASTARKRSIAASSRRDTSTLRLSSVWQRSRSATSSASTSLAIGASPDTRSRCSTAFASRSWASVRLFMGHRALQEVTAG